MRSATLRKEKAFSLIELVVGLGLFMLIAATAFRLLNVSQQRYQMESQFLESFQTARLAMDQITRDVHSAGYPPLNSFSPATAAANPQRVAQPFAWTPTYPATPCIVGVTCTVPGPFDLIVEADVDPQNNNGLEWIRYQLQGTTLFRGVATKTAGTDPATPTQATLVPYVDNVMNNASATQMNFIRTFYPTMFPGNNPVPVFTYTFDPGVANTPPNLRQVNITLIVQAPNPDPKTGQPRLLTLTGLVRRMNPSQ